jgi:hypothetical protein
VSLEAPGYLPAPPGDAGGGECLVVWDGDALPEELRAWLRARFDLEVPGSLPIASVSAPHRHAPGLEYRAFYVRLPQGAGRCR